MLLFLFVRSDSKVKFRQASNRCRTVLKAAKLAYTNKTKIANSILNKGKSATPPLFNGPEAFSSASDKVKLFAENFLRTLILLTQISLYLLSLLELI